MWPNNQAILLKIGLVLAVVVTSWLLIACIALQTGRPATAATATVPGTRRDPTAPATPGAATPAGALGRDARSDRVGGLERGKPVKIDGIPLGVIQVAMLRVIGEEGGLQQPLLLELADRPPDCALRQEGELLPPPLVGVVDPAPPVAHMRLAVAAEPVEYLLEDDRLVEPDPRREAGQDNQRVAVD